MSVFCEREIRTRQLFHDFCSDMHTRLYSPTFYWPKEDMWLIHCQWDRKVYFSQGGNAGTCQWVEMDNPFIYVKEKENKYLGKKWKYKKYKKSQLAFSGSLNFFLLAYDWLVRRDNQQSSTDRIFVPILQREKVFMHWANG